MPVSPVWIILVCCEMNDSVHLLFKDIEVMTVSCYDEWCAGKNTTYSNNVWISSLGFIKSCQGKQTCLVVAILGDCQMTS